MTHEEMLAMAREAGLGEHTNYMYEQIWELKNIEALKRFAALVTAAERERCAKVCEERADKYGEGDGYSPTKESACYECAYAIRKGE